MKSNQLSKSIFITQLISGVCCRVANVQNDNKFTATVTVVNLLVVCINSLYLTKLFIILNIN